MTLLYSSAIVAIDSIHDVAPEFTANVLSQFSDKQTPRKKCPSRPNLCSEQFSPPIFCPGGSPTGERQKTFFPRAIVVKKTVVCAGFLCNNENIKTSLTFIVAIFSLNENNCAAIYYFWFVLLMPSKLLDY